MQIPGVIMHSNLTEKKYAEKLARYIEATYDSQLAASKHLDIHKNIISECCHSKRNDKKLAKEMGYEVVKEIKIVYKPIEGEPQCF